MRATVATRAGRIVVAVAAASRARELARAQHSPRLEGDSLLRLAFAHLAASPPRVAAGREALREAEPLVARAADPLLEVRLLWARGNLENEAARTDLSRLPFARRAWEEALARVRAIGWGASELGLVTNLAQLCSNQGDLVASERELRAGIERAAALGSREGRARLAMRLAQTLRMRGALVEARELAVSAAATFAALGDAGRENEARAELPDLDLAGGDAEAAYHGFLAIAERFRELGHPSRARWSDVDGAWAALELSRPPADLRETLRGLVAYGEEIGDLMLQASSRAALAKALLRPDLGAVDARAAVREAARAVELAAPPSWPPVSMRVAQAHAEALLAAGDLAGARAAAQRLVAAGRRSGSRLGELEGRLVLARLDAGRGEAAGARAALEAVALDAEAIGYLSLSRRVAEARAATLPPLRG
jgi:hypothetical protein